MTDASPDDIERQLSERFASRRSPFLDLLGVTFVFEDGQPVTRCTVSNDLLRGFNIAHGGVLCTLLDTSLGAVAYAAAMPRLANESKRTGERRELVTLQLETHFIRPAWNGERLAGRGEVVHLGRTTIVVRGDVRTAAGEVVVSGAATFMPTTIAKTANG